MPLNDVVIPHPPKHPRDIRDYARISVGALVGFEDGDSRATASADRITIYDENGLGGKREWSWDSFLANQERGGEWLFWGAYLLTLEWTSPHGWLGPVDAIARLRPPAPS